MDVESLAAAAKDRKSVRSVFPVTDNQLADSCFMVDIALEIGHQNRFNNL